MHKLTASRLLAILDDETLRESNIVKQISSRLTIAITVLAALFLTACTTTQSNVQRASEYKIIAYAMGRTDFSRINAAKLTHINYAFGLVNTNGEAFVRSNAPSHLAQLQALKARNPNLKVILSIGGWGADNFSDAALTDESRQKFARSCVNILKLYALDGIDLDWEYPGQPGPGIKFRAEDKENFTAMLRECRLQLDQLSDSRKRTGSDRYTLTIASAGGKYFEHTEMEKVQQQLDWINIMTYDFYGVGSRPGHHAGLFQSKLYPPDNKARRTTESDVEDHLRAGTPPSKLVIGAAFYGKTWTNVTLEPYLSGGKHQRGGSYAALKRGALSDNQFENKWDPDAKASYLWNPTTKTFISYESPEALKAKCDFVKERKLGGIMYWEYSEDFEETLLNVLAGELGLSRMPR
jgi:chitinase